METEVFNRSHSTSNENSSGNSSKNIAMGAAAAVGAVAVGGAAVYGASQYLDTDDVKDSEKQASLEAGVIAPNPEDLQNKELAMAEPVVEEKPTVTHVTNHFHNHFDAPEPEPDVVHIVHHNEPMPQFTGAPDRTLHIHEEVVHHHHIHDPEPDIHITKNVDIVHNHIHVPEPPVASPIDVIANDVLAQGEFVDPMAVDARNLDMASVDMIQTIDGQQLSAASFTSPSGEDMFLVDVPEPNALTVQEVTDPIEPIGYDAPDDPARFLAQGAVDIIADEIGGHTGDLIHDVNDLAGLDSTRSMAHGAVDIIADEFGGNTGDIIHDVNDLIGLV